MASQTVEKMKAAAACLKMKAFLAKEKPGLKVRADKWRVLLEEATQSKDTVAKRNAEAALQSAEQYAYVIRTLDEYVKRFSILRADGQQVQRFLRAIENGNRAANKAYTDYTRDKMAALQSFNKKGKYNARDVSWLDNDSPGWKLARGIVKVLTTDLRVNIRIG